MTDFATAYFSIVAAYLLWHATGVSSSESGQSLDYIIHFPSVAAFSLLVVLVLNASGAYSYQRYTSLTTELLIVARATILSFVLGEMLTYLFGKNSIPRSIFAFLLLCVFGLLSLQKVMMYRIASRLRARGTNRKRILIVGTGTRAAKFIEVVRQHFDWGLDVVGLLTSDPEKVGETYYGHPVLNTYDQIEDVLRTVNPEEVIITISTRQFDQVRTVLEACEREGVQVRLNSDSFGQITKKVRIDNVYGLNIISFSTVKYSELQLILKRLIDIAGAALILLVSFPIMLVAVIGIWISDGRPIFYEWKVIGLNKIPFTGWKFRTMNRNADQLKKDLIESNEMDGPVFKIKNDPRVFWFGRLLRKWSIDETPQLWSVLKGDMSLVGPRPSFPHELEQYESWQRRRLSVKPGITCLWQINGRNDIHKFDEWVRMDLEYIDHWSLWLDIKIILKTVPAVLSGKGAR